MDALLQSPAGMPPRTTLDTVLELLSLLLLSCSVVFLMGAWPALPATIPRHFNFAGSPDAWGGKSVLLILPAVSFFLYGLLTFLGRDPLRFPPASPRQAADLLRQAVVVRSLLAAIKAELLALLLYLEVQTACVAWGAAKGLAGWAVLSFPVLVLATIAAFLVPAFTVKK